MAQHQGDVGVFRLAGILQVNVGEIQRLLWSEIASRRRNDTAEHPVAFHLLIKIHAVYRNSCAPVSKAVEFVYQGATRTASGCHTFDSYWHWNLKNSSLQESTIAL